MSGSDSDSLFIGKKLEFEVTNEHLEIEFLRKRDPLKEFFKLVSRCRIIFRLVKNVFLGW